MLPIYRGNHWETIVDWRIQSHLSTRYNAITKVGFELPRSEHLDCCSRRTSVRYPNESRSDD